MLVEISVLGGRLATADIWLPYDQTGQAELGLIIQVDGEGHTCSPLPGRTLVQQQARDEQFNAECWHQGHKLLRLHHADKHEWHHYIQFAILHGLCWPTRRFACFTSSFERTAVCSTRDR